MRRVISLWLPRFATDRISRKKPALKNKPLVLVREYQTQLKIYAVNAAADEVGLRPGMALADAQAVLPNLTICSNNTTLDKKMLLCLAKWCNQYSPWTSDSDPTLSLESGGSSGLWLDATGCSHLFGGEKMMLSNMIKRIGRMGFSARAAIADTPGCAWAVARFAKSNRPYITVPPGKTKNALSPLPIAALRYCPVTIQALYEIGIKRIADVINIPRAPLSARFEEAINTQLDAVLGKIKEPLSPIPPKIPLVAQLAFAEPIGNREEIVEAINLILKDLCRKLERAGYGARQLILTLYRSDNSSTQITIGTAQANRNPVHLANLFESHLEKIDPGFGIEKMILTTPIADHMKAVQINLQGKKKVKEKAVALIDRLSNRLGADNVLQANHHKSYIPERVASFIPISKENNFKIDKKALENPRPLRLLRPAERIKVITKNIDGAPISFCWRQIVYHTHRYEGPERISPEWWLSNLDMTRDYYRIENESGQRFWLYKEGETKWFLHGIFG